MSDGAADDNDASAPVEAPAPAPEPQPAGPLALDAVFAQLARKPR